MIHHHRYRHQKQPERQYLPEVGVQSEITTANRLHLTQQMHPVCNGSKILYQIRFGHNLNFAVSYRTGWSVASKYVIAHSKCWRRFVSTDSIDTSTQPPPDISRMEEINASIWLNRITHFGQRHFERRYILLLSRRTYFTLKIKLIRQYWLTNP